MKQIGAEVERVAVIGGAGGSVCTGSKCKSRSPEQVYRNRFRSRPDIDVRPGPPVASAALRGNQSLKPRPR